MKVLLFGGTGAIGSYLSQILCDNGIKHSITSRREKTSSEYITFIKGNAHDLDFIQALCKEHWDVIIDFMAYKTEEFESHINTMLNSTDQYVYISSARVYGDEEHPITEHSPRLLDCSRDETYLSTDEYALTKARQEDILKKYGKKNYTIIRPYITYGEERFQLGVLEKEEWLFRALHGRTVVFSEDIAKRLTSFTNGYDVAMGIYKILGQESALCKEIHFINRERITWMEIFNIYKICLRKYNRSIKIKLIPTEKFLTTRDERLKYQVIYDRLYDRFFDTTRGDEYLDSKTFIKIEVGLEQCLSEFLNAPKWKNINWIFEAKKDRIVGEYTPLSQIGGWRNKIRYILYRFVF